MHIDRLDHLVLTVADLAATTTFYRRVLGMEPVESDGRHALQFARQKINLHLKGHEFEPKAAHPTPGSGDLCFIATGRIEQLLEHLARCRIPIIEGPVSRAGALGPVRSVYIRDPDRNLIEIAVYADATEG